MNNKYKLNESKDDPKNNLRIITISALVALSTAVLAILHGNVSILGQTIQPGSFIEGIFTGVR